MHVFCLSHTESPDSVRQFRHCLQVGILSKKDMMEMALGGTDVLLAVKHSNQPQARYSAPEKSQ